MVDLMCPVCGYPELYEPAYSGRLGSLEYCQCCGFQFGVTDDDRGITHEEWRAAWIKNGMVWDSESIHPPANWNPEQQLLNLLKKGGG